MTSMSPFLLRAGRASSAVLRHGLSGEDRSCCAIDQSAIPKLWAGPCRTKRGQ